MHRGLARAGEPLLTVFLVLEEFVTDDRRAITADQRSLESSGVSLAAAAFSFYASAIDGSIFFLFPTKQLVARTQDCLLLVLYLF